MATAGEHRCFGNVLAEKRPWRTKPPRGFTLVELLVVVGIIAVLISVLLPALSKARQAARNIQCQSTLRELTLAWTQYANDNKGGIAGDEWWRCGSQYRQIPWYFRRQHVAETPWVTVCPEMIDYAGLDVTPYWGITYQYNSFWYTRNVWVTPGRWLKMGRVRDTHQKIVFLDGVSKNIWVTNWLNVGDWIMNGRHGSKASGDYNHQLGRNFNTSFGDGHVEFMMLRPAGQFPAEFYTHHLDIP